MLRIPCDVMIHHIASRLDTRSICNVSSSCTSIHTILKVPMRDRRILYDREKMLAELRDKTALIANDLNAYQYGYYIYWSMCSDRALTDIHYEYRRIKEKISFATSQREEFLPPEGTLRHASGPYDITFLFEPKKLCTKENASSYWVIHQARKGDIKVQEYKLDGLNHQLASPND